MERAGQDGSCPALLFMLLWDGKFLYVFSLIRVDFARVMLYNCTGKEVECFATEANRNGSGNHPRRLVLQVTKRQPQTVRAPHEAGKSNHPVSHS